MNRQSKIALAVILLCFTGMVLGLANLVTGGLLLWSLGFSLSGVALNILNQEKKGVSAPETDDNGYIIDPARAAQIDLLEEECQVGEYAPGKTKHKCQHEWIDKVCFWCGKSETPHRPRRFVKHSDGNPAVEALEIALEEPSSDTNMERAMRIGVEFVSNGQARLVKAALEHIGVRRVTDLSEDQIEPFIQRLLYESMRPEPRLSNPGRKERR